MRLLVALLTLSILTPSAARGQSCVLAGTWRLESMRYFRSANDTGIVVPVREPQLKVITSTHFAYLRQLGDSAILDQSGRLQPVVGSRVWGGAGTYVVQGDRYTERFEIAEPRAMVGTAVQARCTVTGDVWLHDFTFPDGQARLLERYRRVAP